MPSNNPDVVYPELRLVTFDQHNKVVPTLCVSGDYIAKSLIKSDSPEFKTRLEALIKLLLTHIKVREGDGRWVIPDNHENHPSLYIAQQLLQQCLQGRSGYRVIVSDDKNNPDRKYLIFQVDKPNS